MLLRYLLLPQYQQYAHRTIQVPSPARKKRACARLSEFSPTGIFVLNLFAMALRAKNALRLGYQDLALRADIGMIGYQDFPYGLELMLA